MTLEALNYGKALTFIGVFVAVCLLVMTAIMLDLWDGVYTARKTGERVHSHKLRVTMGKMSEYWRYIFIGFLMDCLGIFFHFYVLPFVAILFGVCLLIVETKSMFEHAQKRKSHTSELPDILRRIVAASNMQEARDILQRVTETMNAKPTETT